MTGIVEMTRTFGLELLESLLTKFPAVFEKHEQVCYETKTAEKYKVGYVTPTRRMSKLNWP
jgi:hypothetical protein